MLGINSVVRPICFVLPKKKNSSCFTLLCMIGIDALIHALMGLVSIHHSCL
jgi:hypothetical protein